MYLAMVSVEGNLQIARRQFDGSSSFFTYETHDQNISPDGRPDILSHNGMLHVVWRTSSGTIATMTKSSSGPWSAPLVLNEPTGGARTTGIPPTLAISPLFGLHMLRTRANTTLDLLAYDESTGTWVDADTSYDIPDGLYETPHEAQMAWFQGFTDEPEGPGHWHIAFRETNRTWMTATVGTTQDRKIHLMSSRDSAMLELFYMPEHDNIVGVYGNVGAVRFMPFADGVVGLPILDNNDFESMSESICFGYTQGLPNDSRPCGRLGPVNALTHQNYFTGVCDGY